MEFSLLPPLLSILHSIYEQWPKECPLYAPQVPVFHFQFAYFPQGTWQEEGDGVYDGFHPMSATSELLYSAASYSACSACLLLSLRMVQN